MNTRHSKLFFFLSVFLIVAAATSCSSHPQAGMSLVPDALLATEDEQMLWKKSEHEQRALESSGLIYSAPELEAYLNQVVAKLKPETAPAELNLRVKVIKNPYLNAFAYPNGLIYIHTGFTFRAHF